MGSEAVIKSWFKKSRDDLFSAKILLEAKSKRTLTQTTYMAQQSIEKAMKGLIVYLGKRPQHTHKLEKLADIINDLEPHIDVIQKYDSHWKIIELYSLYHRYPDAAGTDGVELPTEEKASEIVDIAQDVFDELLKISVVHPKDLLEDI